MKTKVVLKIWLEFFLFLASYVAVRWALQRFVLPAAPPCGWDVFTITLVVAGLLVLVILNIVNEEKSIFVSLWLAVIACVGSFLWTVQEGLEITRYATLAAIIIFSFLFIIYFFTWMKARTTEPFFRSKLLFLLIQGAVVVFTVGLTEKFI